MKRFISFFTASLALYLNSGAQIATVNLTGDTKIEPGVTNRVTLSVKNNQGVAIQKYQSDYVLTMIYKGSTSAGSAFNKSIIISDPIGPGATKNFDISFTGPLIPGEYDVEACLKWGSKVVSTVDKVTFVVAEKYEVSIIPKVTSYYVERGRTQYIDLKFTLTNSGNTTWPDGKYGLDFVATSSPSSASAADRKVFDKDPDEIEYMDLEPGKSAEFGISKFIPPYSDGTYSFRVTVLKDGRPFDADGNSKTITLKFSVK